MIIYQIDLPKAEDAEAFADFMRDEYLPAVHTGATRVGQVTSLSLLQGRTDTNESAPEFILHAGWSGLSSGDIRMGDEAIQKKFTGFGASMKRLGFFREVFTKKEATSG